MKCLVGSLLVVGTVGLPSVVSAQVIINEIAWMGTPVAGVEEKQWWRYEWIELYNPTAMTIRVDGWKVELYREELDFEIVLSASILAHGYFLIGASERIPGIDVDYGNFAGKFANSGQRIVLKNAAGTVVEEVEAAKGWFAGDNELKLTMERRFPERDANDPDNWGSSNIVGGTPKSENTLFEKEKFLPVRDRQTSPLFPIKKSIWSSVVGMLRDPIFLRALMLALVSTVGILALRRYVLDSQ